MSHFSHIVIIYNPNSTGNGKKLAQALASDLRQLTITAEVQLIPTKYAGHGEELAARYAKQYPRPLIVSSSGDGGYNEIINGVLKSGSTTATTSVLPAGNANDHHTALRAVDYTKRIARSEVQTIDTLLLETTIDGKPWCRYAHSYIGLGITPQIGEELTKAKLNPINEIWLVFRNLFKVRPIKLIFNNRAIRYDSIVFSNIDRMSKIMNLSDKSSVMDGKFEIAELKSGSWHDIFVHIFKASTVGLKNPKQASEYKFKTARALPVQFDGEVETLPAGSDVIISCESRTLQCII